MLAEAEAAVSEAAPDAAVLDVPAVEETAVPAAEEAVLAADVLEDAALAGREVTLSADPFTRVDSPSSFPTLVVPTGAIWVSPENCQFK